MLRITLLLVINIDLTVLGPLADFTEHQFHVSIMKTGNVIDVSQEMFELCFFAIRGLT